jgi:hypothetical protein
MRRASGITRSEDARRFLRRLSIRRRLVRRRGIRINHHAGGLADAGRALNRTVAFAVVHGPEAALAELDLLERDGRLAGYHYLAAVRADLLRRLGRTDEAAQMYRRAIGSCDNDAERAFLTDRLASVQVFRQRGLGKDPV